MSGRRACRSAIGVAVLGVLGGGGHSARAGCGVGPAIVWAPPSGTALPANPTIYVFLRRPAADTAATPDELTVTDGDGRPVVFARADLKSEGTSSVVRLDIKVTAGKVAVRGRAGTENGEATYRLGARVRETGLGGTEITEASYVYRSGCPSSNGFVLSIDPEAPAYRVELDDHVWIVPDGERWRARHGTIVTGYLGCDDFVIPTDRPLALSITPLDADGSEGARHDEGCVRARFRCRKISHDETSCTGGMLDCSSAGAFSVTGRVVWDNPLARVARKKKKLGRP